jgi:hypothetical protein
MAFGIQLLAVALAATAAAGSPAPGASGDPASTASMAAPSQTATADDKVTCRTVIVTGSRLGGKRLCHTQEQWRELQRDNQKTISDMQRRGVAERLPGT